MKNLTIEEKEKLIKFIEDSNKEVRAYAITRMVPLDIFVKMAMVEENEYVVMSILQKLELEKETEELKENYAKLAKASSWQIREFVAKNAPLSIVVYMAKNVSYFQVLPVILERLENASDSEEIKESYSYLFNVSWSGIREFVAKNAPLEIIIDMAIIEKELRVLNVLQERLEAQIDTDLVKENYSKLSKAEDFKIREIVAQNAPISVIIDMLVNENSSSVEKIILERLEKVIDTDEVKQSFSKLAKARNSKIKKIVAQNVAIKTIIEMALVEEDSEVVKEIVERLENENETEEVKKYYKKLLEAKHGQVRAFAARNTSLENVVNMAQNDKDFDVIKEILKRLENEIDTDEVKQSFNKLAKSKDWHIRLFVAKNAPISVIIKMALIECDIDVKDVILERLEAEKEVEEVKNCYKKLANAKYSRIREYIVRVAPLEIVIKMVLIKENNDIMKEIIKRLNKEASENNFKDNYTDISMVNNLQIREFVAKNAPISVIIRMAVIEETEEVINEIIKRLKLEVDTDEVKQNFSKLAKANDWRVRAFVMTYAPDEVVQKNLLRSFERKKIKEIQNLI